MVSLLWNRQVMFQSSQSAAPLSPTSPIAYFCAEFAMRSDLPIYAGGLGILAGDVLRAAAQQGLPMVGVGLLYRGEAAAQSISATGEQEETDVPVEPLSLGLEPVHLDDHPLYIKVHLTEVDVWVECWKMQLSPTVTLYLLDTDNEQNLSTERDICRQLYAGTEEALLKQQLILGIGGVKLLHVLGIHPHAYHLNEGRPAFLHWQLIRSYMDEHGMDFTQAREAARQKTIYTNHTLVGAGNPHVSSSLLKVYAQYYADKMGVAVEELLQLGLEEDPELFWTTRFALNVSHKASAVSQLHGELSKQTWPEYDWSSITNGVDMDFWQDSRFRESSLENMSDERIWEIHRDNKRQTMEFVRAQTGYEYNPDWLVITWARRIAGYKHLDWLFADLDRLIVAVRSTDRPIQLLVAGKAHRHDTQGKALLKQVIGYFQKELTGHALFVPNYNLDVARHLVKGSDVWLNTPELGKEASGTSGMKAISNGVLHCTTPDGWAAEVEWPALGWSLDPSDPANHLYRLLEGELPEAYYNRTPAGLPTTWLAKMRASLALSPKFSAERMVREYCQQLYQLPG
jgi:glycogen phosphorylase